MKGAIFSISQRISEKDLTKILENGLYSIWQNSRDKENNIKPWGKEQAGTFADYLALNPGDKIFFFRDRKIYGIGELVGIKGQTGFLNYPDSDCADPGNPSETDAIIQGNGWIDCRVVFPFVASPILFKNGIDMDEVLSSPFANFFYGLRFWSGQSFRLLGEEETRILSEMFLRRFSETSDVLKQIVSEKKLMTTLQSRNHGVFSAERLLSKNQDSYLNGKMFKIENWLHALVIEYLKKNQEEKLLHDDCLRNIFREVPASPPKPPQWSDKIDVLRTSHHAKNQQVTVKYTIIEMKRDYLKPKKAQDFNAIVGQVTKYVDFLAKNYVEGNYGAIEAKYIAKGYSEDFIKYFNKSTKPVTEESEVTPITRSYVLDSHSSNPVKIWNNFELIEYTWNKETRNLELDIVETKID